MSAVTVLIARLKDVAAVTDITGVGGIHYARVPQEASPPFILIHRVNEDDEMMLDGPGGLRETRLSLECTSTATLEMENLGEAVIAALTGTAKVSIGGATNVEFRKAGTDVTDYAEDRSLSARIIDFYMRWRE